jgi:Cu2+-exporting ATPase
MGIYGPIMTMTDSSALQTEHLPLCDHCQLPCEDLFTLEIKEEKRTYNFCCHGCQTVHQILRTNNLLNFYDIAASENQQPYKVTKKDNSFSHFDTKEFIKDYAVIDENTITIKFYLDNIHCMACLWLIEKTPHFIEGLINTRLDISNSIATFVIEKNKSLASIAREIAQLGYYPHPIKLDGGHEELQRKTQRKEFLRIGIAGAAMMNIMIYAISNYAGADGGYRLTFDWISFAFAIPVVLFSAVPFYQSSLQALKQKRANIDLPLSIAIIFGFLLSTYSILTKTGEQYFDTISSLVFLILLSRYFVKYATQKGLDTKGLNTFFTNSGVRKVTDNGIISVHSDYINLDDTVLYEAGETILFDGIVQQNKVAVDSSIISGESKPQLLDVGETVYAGSKNLEGQALIKTTAMADKTRVGQIINKVQMASNDRPEIVQKADFFAQRFVLIILAITASAITYYSYTADIHTALNIGLSIIIISCPCALALATPLAFIKALTLLKTKGVFIKSDKVLESLNKIKTLVLDKTGTITKGKFKVLSFKKFCTLSNDEIFSLIYTLESKSIHPIAITLKKYAERLAKPLELEEVNEITGQGITAKVDGSSYFIGKPKQPIQTDNNHTIVALYKDDELLAYLTLGDEIKEDSEMATKALMQDGIDLIIASGDQETVTQSIGQRVGIKKDHIFGNQTPEQKAHLVSQYPSVAMVGDGANDALAMKRSSLGIAVAGAMDISLRASDVFLTKPSLTEIADLFHVSKETEKIIKRNFAFSLAYNCLGVGFALMGLVTPLFAAILMPISSLTVLFSTIIGTRKLRLMAKKVSV